MFIGVIILLILSFIMAIFSGYFFNLESATRNKVFIFINILLLLFVGFYIARRVENHGWLNGGMGGLIYMAIMVLFGAFSMPVSFLNIFFLLILGLVAGSIGGIIGINI